MELMTKILLIEDNEMNRDMLARRLKRRGYEVIVAVDGQAGIDMAHSENPDLILMDLSLPVIDGWTATSQLKADDDTRQIPIIALTAHVSKKDRDSCFDAGCDAFEGKPINFRNLMETMSNVLAIKGKQLIAAS